MRGLRWTSRPGWSRFLWHGVLSAVLAVTAMTAPVPAVAGSIEHDDCVRRLLEAPIGEAAPPTGP